MGALRLAATFAAALLLSGCAGRYFEAASDPAPTPRYALADLPQKEIWTGVIFNGNKIGFSRLKVEALPDSSRYRLETESSIRIRLLGFDKRVLLRSSDVVREDLSLVSFRSDYLIDGSELKLVGEANPGELRVTIDSGSSRSVQKLPIVGKVYPASALALLPVVEGLRIGARYTLNVYNGEVQRLSEAVQTVEAWETSKLFEGPAFKVTTDMLGLSSTSWIDVKGRPLLELGLNGVLISALEDESHARSYLAAAAVNQDDVLVEWSLVKPQAPISAPRSVKHLSIALSGPAVKAPVSDARQRCRASGSRWMCEIDANNGEASAEVPPRYLGSSITVRPKDPAIAALARQVAPPALPPADKIQAILAWMGQNIRKEAADVFSARDVLDQRRAECQGHSYLYASLARAARMPTRIVNGLVYSEEHGGFLYHTWAETLVDGRWRAVDPTFGQSEADATHVALLEGEESADLLPITEWVGNTRIEVLSAGR